MCEVKKPHVHAELIKAWADGAEIEWRRYKEDEWVPVSDSITPGWYFHWQYRIKPTPKPDVVYYVVFDRYRPDKCSVYPLKQKLFTYDVAYQFKWVFDGETNKLKSQELCE